MPRPYSNKKITYEELSKHFSKPIKQVASELGVCTTVLKKECRKHGITRWPHRKIQSINKMIRELKKGNPENESKVQEQVEQLFGFQLWSDFTEHNMFGDHKQKPVGKRKPSAHNVSASHSSVYHAPPILKSHTSPDQSPENKHSSSAFKHASTASIPPYGTDGQRLNPNRPVLPPLTQLLENTTAPMGSKQLHPPRPVLEPPFVSSALSNMVNSTVANVPVRLSPSVYTFSQHNALPMRLSCGGY